MSYNNLFSVIKYSCIINYLYYGYLKNAQLCKNGSDGRDGRDGLNGINGTNGTDGKNGLDGKTGKDGKDGLNGRNGQDGAPGKPGENWKECAWMNVNDEKDVGLVKVKFSFEIVLV